MTNGSIESSLWKQAGRATVPYFIATSLVHQTNGLVLIEHHRSNINEVLNQDRIKQNDTFITCKWPQN